VLLATRPGLNLLLLAARPRLNLVLLATRPEVTLSGWHSAEIRQLQNLLTKGTLAASVSDSKER